MKTILLLLLVCGSITAQRPQRQVLYDFRNDRASQPPKISPATQRDVLAKVFRAYLRNANRCKTDFEAGEEFLAAARRAGQIVPDIAEVVTGSFTAAGRNETAYVIFVNECNASHADNFGSKRIAIFSGATLVADLDLEFKSSVVLRTDLDKDGIDELLMTSGDMAQGEILQLAGLLSFKNGRLQVVQDFGTVVNDTCATARPGSTTKAAVLSYTNAAPGQMPRFRVDNYTAGCGKVRRWRALRTSI